MLTEGTMATGYNVRIGDADREAIAAQLREHYADGRLTLDELNERLDQTFAAKTKADLDVVMRDLPHVARPFTGAPAAGFGNTAWQGQTWQGQTWQGQAWPGQTGQSGWDYGSGSGPRCGRRAAFAPLLVLMWVALVFGAVTLFGIGGDRPLAIVLLLAAVAFLKRLFGFGGRRRGSGRSRGPKGPRRGPRGPRF
jgi:Domain of unknown function (DUF1707)